LRDWFKNHTAKLHKFTSDAHPGTLQKLIWHQPGTWVNCIQYVIDTSWLFVYGDLGEAVYEWSGSLSFDWLAGLDLDYFGSKCQASSEEPKGKTWDSDRVQAWIEEKLKEWAEENPIINTDGPEEGEQSRTPLTFKECADLMWEEDLLDDSL